MSDTYFTWSRESFSNFAFLPWVVSFLCLLISIKWISPLLWAFVQVPVRNLLSVAIVSEKSEERDGSKLEKAYIQTISISEQEESVKTSTTYNEDWLISPHIFSLEQRSIFSKIWLYAIHRSRFTKPGDYHTLTLATFSIFIILGQDQKIRAFHNVCRHRAYTITKKASGSSTVLGCRYHGWSYNTRGELVKAPEFEGLHGFDKKLNSLFEIRTQVTSAGCVFVNFDASEPVQEFDGAGLSVIDNWKIGTCRWIDSWALEGNFNWKITEDVEDNPEIKDQTTTIVSKWSSIFPLFRKQAYQKSLHLFPGTKFYLSPSGKTWISVRHMPQIATKTTIQVDLYTSLLPDDRSNQILSSRLKSHFQERVRQLEEKQASFIHDGISKEILVKQDAIHSLLIAHSKMEKLIGREIYPAFRQEAFSETGQQDDDLCKELEEKKPGSLDGCIPSSGYKESIEW